ncbi:protein OBERON 3-like isoform X1 [Glycine soja]|uniref:Protein OBERON 3 n=1 Tax=Glycine soja TaxID=3848 RepID=A0A445JC47_GLYSO|nr:protein OBERON 3-like isoform X1 [Glycine soja]KHN12477.1 Protein OBERON 3 [Glycine soja]RZB96056.1 Protein OBERON 3 [Glycine soja]
MIGSKDRSADFEGENSRSKLSRHNFEANKEYPDEKGVEFLRDSSEVGGCGGSSGLQELTLSYLCDNPKFNLAEKEIPGKSLLEKMSHKGKEVVVCENSYQDGKWVERDFLSLSEPREDSSKRSLEEVVERESNREKKPKLEILNLSLALPDVSLSLTASNALQNGGDHQQQVRTNPCRPSSTTHTSYSNDYTAASLSYSYSHPFSHNPSCSLTHNSTDMFDYSVSKDDQIWNCGEGTNGSVHSRFKPIRDGLVGLSNHGGGGGISSFMQGNNNSQYKTTTSSDNHSFFPSELPARPRFEAQSGDSRGRNSENLRVLDDGKARKISRPERIVREIVSESIPVMTLTIQELTDDVIASTKEYLRNLIEKPEKKEELVSLQSRLERRSDLTKESLSKCHKVQLEVLVAVKMGLASFLSSQIQLSEMVEVFLFKRCRNVTCKHLLPVDDCDCKICSGNKGFCSSCMCPVCLNFDCASNTCSWIGCDVCSHWCHATCGIQRNLIKPGPSLKGPSGTSEMQFHCIGCGHASEMFGFVKDVFMCCAKDWGLETLMKELDCVRKIFMGSEDRKGKELHVKTDDMLLKLQTRMISPSDASSYIMQYFSYADSMPDFPASGISSKDLSASQSNLTKDTPSLSKPNSLLPKYGYDMGYSRSHPDAMSCDLLQKDLKASILSELKNEADFHLGALLRKGGLESLESIVRIKEAEARMFQTKADEARREAEGFQRMIRTKTAQMEEEYAEKLSKLCLHETEETQRKKLDELKVLENSYFDYYKMKKRMQDEIDGLLRRMEATKQQWV